MIPTKIGPVAADSEMIVIGRLLQSFEALALVRLQLQPDDFFSAHHRTIVRIALAASYPPEEEVPLLQIGRDLRTAGKLEEIGSHAYLTELIDKTTTDAVLPSHVRRIRSAASARTAMTVALQIYEAASEWRDWQTMTHPLHLLAAHSDKAMPRIAKRSFLAAGPV